MLPLAFLLALLEALLLFPLALLAVVDFALLGGSLSLFLMATSVLFHWLSTEGGRAFAAL